jgi:1-acyl-sn-glycerol-3-phosphate acyltransferase
MFRLLSIIILKTLGWKITNAIPPGMKKCVIIVAPHTSNLDFVIGRFAYGAMGVKVRFLIKKEAFKFPMGGLLRILGGIPVDRSRNNKMVEHVSGLFEKNESFYVVITPEGTRKPNAQWKKGFWYIAERTKLPIALAFIDYEHKRGGVDRIMYPSADIDADMREIKKFYTQFKGRHPERFRTGLE